MDNPKFESEPQYSVRIKTLYDIAGNTIVFYDGEPEPINAHCVVIPAHIDEGVLDNINKALKSFLEKEDLNSRHMFIFLPNSLPLSIENGLFRVITNIRNMIEYINYGSVRSVVFPQPDNGHIRLISNVVVDLFSKKIIMTSPSRMQDFNELISQLTQSVLESINNNKEGEKDRLFGALLRALS